MTNPRSASPSSRPQLQGRTGSDPSRRNAPTDGAAPLSKKKSNALLSALPDNVFDQLSSDMKEVEIARGHVFFEPEQALEFAYFPNSGLLSVLAVMEDGTSAEIACVGSEGMVGMETLLGNGVLNLRRCIGQSPGTAIRIRMTRLKHVFDGSAPFRSLILSYAQCWIHEISQTAACNRLHPVEERLARWLLICVDRTRSTRLELTHDFLANMLGVRRSTVTIATGILQKANVIRYTRGHIEVLDRQRLQKVSCECYALLKENGRHLSRNNFKS